MLSLVWTSRKISARSTGQTIAIPPPAGLTSRPLLVPVRQTFDLYPRTKVDIWKQQLLIHSSKVTLLMRQTTKTYSSVPITSRIRTSPPDRPKLVSKAFPPTTPESDGIEAKMPNRLLLAKWGVLDFGWVRNTRSCCTSSYVKTCVSNCESYLLCTANPNGDTCYDLSPSDMITWITGFTNTYASLNEFNL